MDWIDKLNEELERNRQETNNIPDKTYAAQSGYAKAREAALKKADPDAYHQKHVKAHKKMKQKLGDGYSKHQAKAGTNGGSNTAARRKKEGYFQSEEWKQNQSRGGKTSGQNNVKSGHLDKIRDAANAISHSKIQCVHCKEPGDYLNIVRYHNDNCDYPKFKQYITQCKPEEEEFRIKPFINKIAKLSGVSKDRINALLKRRYVVPSGKHNMWKWDPVAEDADNREVKGAMYKKLPYSDPDRLNKLAQMLYDLIPFDNEFTIKDLPNVQSQCEYRLNIRHLLINSPNHFEWRKEKITYIYKKVKKS